MPRYYFDVDYGDRYLIDDKGTELADYPAARDEGNRAINEMAKDYVPSGPPQPGIKMFVRDENDDLLLEIALIFGVQSAL